MNYSIEKQLHAGGLCILAAIGPNGKLLTGVPCRPKSPARWLGARVVKRERVRLAKAVAEVEVIKL
jgi:hypothetical protein